jgi:glycosyltransferase involved in cell wall biosynthesis
LDLFRPKKQTEFDGEIRLVYHGRLDKHRGVLALPILAQKLQSKINCKLTLIGEGDVFEQFSKMEKTLSWLELYPTLTHKELASVLQNQHIGLLPMPKTKVWSLASPLKRSEYLASGLLIFGTEHAGHALEFTDKSWYYLTEQDKFHDAGLTWISEQNEESIVNGKKTARKFAVENCSWEISIKQLDRALYLAKSDS